MKTFISDLSKKSFPLHDKVSGKTIRQSILELIQKDCPGFTNEHCAAVTEINHYREKYIADYLLKENKDLDKYDKTVLEAITDETLLINKINSEPTQIPSLGQRVADKVATFGGSWTFIILFGCILMIWILFNVVWLQKKAFDPYPFILLNLILSCVAALQAPVIMMSQNRQEEKDRERAKMDYMINLKAELEIRILHEKIDHLILHQQQELMEVQKIQVELMNDILQKVNR